MEFAAARDTAGDGAVAMDVDVAGAREGAFALGADKAVVVVHYLPDKVAGAGDAHVDLRGRAVDGGVGRAAEVEIQLVGLDTAVEVGGAGAFHRNLLSRQGEGGAEVGSAGEVDTRQRGVVGQSHRHLTAAHIPPFEVNLQRVATCLDFHLRHDVFTCRDDSLVHRIAHGDIEGVVNIEYGVTAVDAEFLCDGVARPFLAAAEPHSGNCRQCNQILLHLDMF